jgi:hypothetical protein
MCDVPISGTARRAAKKLDAVQLAEDASGAPEKGRDSQFA